VILQTGRGTNAATLAPTPVPPYPAQGTAGGRCLWAPARSLRAVRGVQGRWAGGSSQRHAHKSTRASFLRAATTISHRALARAGGGGTFERSHARRRESKGNVLGRFQALSCCRNWTSSCFPSGYKLSAGWLKPWPVAASALARSVTWRRAKDVDSGWKHAVWNPRHLSEEVRRYALDLSFAILLYGPLHTKNHTSYPDFSSSSSFFLFSSFFHARSFLLSEEKPPLFYGQAEQLQYLPKTQYKLLIIGGGVWLIDKRILNLFKSPEILCAEQLWETRPAAILPLLESVPQGSAQAAAAAALGETAQPDTQINTTEINTFGQQRPGEENLGGRRGRERTCGTRGAVG